MSSVDKEDKHNKSNTEVTSNNFLKQRRINVVQIQLSWMGIAFATIGIGIALSPLNSIAPIILFLIALCLIIFSRTIANKIYKDEMKTIKSSDIPPKRGAVVSEKLLNLLKVIAWCFSLLGLIFFITIIAFPILLMLSILDLSESIIFICTFAASGIISLIVSFMAIKMHPNNQPNESHP